MSLSAIIIAYNYSDFFKQDSGILELNNKPLITHVVDTVEPLVDEIIVVTDSKKRVEIYSKLVTASATFVVEPTMIQNPLCAALSGFKNAHGVFSLLVPYDAPFLSKTVIKLLFELCSGKSAVILRNSDAQAEPFPAVYDTEQALYATEKAVLSGKKDLSALIENLQGVRYLSSLVVKQLDPHLKTLFRVKAPLDLKFATVLLKTKNQKRKKS